MSRYKAFAIHFGISFVVFVLLTALLAMVWFPDFLFSTDGGWEGVRIIVFVDLVLGPLLTLIVFKSGKPGLGFDLACIGVLQAACLAAGVYVVQDERPIAVVYVDGGFYSMSRDDYVEVGASPPARGPFESPVWYIVDVPQDPHAQAKLRGEMLRAGRPLSTRSDLYRPFDASVLPIEDAAPMHDLEDLDRETGSLASWQSEHPGNLDDYLFYAYGARYKYVYLGFERATRRFVGVLDVNAPV